jgi:type 1 fimbria pilin
MGKGKAILAGLGAMLSLAYVSHLSTQPSFNGTTAGCGGGSCHTSQAGILSVTTNNLTVTITLSGATGNVAGELVNGSGSVVVFNNSSSSNPFNLTAPSAGTYTVNAGYKKPNLRWDSKSVSVGTVSTGVTEQVPLQFSLDQNYPNPFNPSTTITYRIASPSFVSLEVLDVIGNTVARLVDEQKVPGEYSLNFDARGLASGVYFYRIKARATEEQASALTGQVGTFVATKKLMLVR